MRRGAILLIFLMAGASPGAALAQATGGANAPDATALRMGIGLPENSRTR